MKRKILLITVSAIALISILGISAIYKIGDIIIEKALEAEFSNILSDSNNNNLYLEGELEIPTVKNTSEITEIDSRKEPREETEAGMSVPSNNKLTSGSEKKDIKAEDNKTLSPGNEVKAGENKIPPEKIKEIKDRVSAADKMKAGTLVLKRLSPSDIDELFAMLEDGVTKEEMERAKKMVYENFTAEEIAEIKEIYRRYMYS